MSVIEDQPKLLKNKAAIEARHKRLQEPHVKPLTDYIETLRIEYGYRKIPYFDPSDGGILAECLFLLEAPGKNAVKSNFISRDNNDETAKNFFLLNREACLPRERTISWNIVPWYIGNDNEKKIKPAAVKDITEGIPHFLCLLELLPKLRVIVFVGKKAKRAEASIRDYKQGLKFFYSLHPSPLVVHHHPDNRGLILKVLKEVSHFIRMI